LQPIQGQEDHLNSQNRAAVYTAFILPKNHKYLYALLMLGVGTKNQSM
jgi:hypothetical protein